MNGYKDRLERAKAMYAEALAVIGDPTAPDEKKSQAREQLDKVREEKAALLELKKLEDARDSMFADLEVADGPQAGPKEWKSWGEFLKETHNWARGLKRDTRLQGLDEDTGRPLSYKDMVESVGASGGFLVPAEFRAELYGVMAEASFVRPRASVIPMTRRSIRIPVLDQTDTTSGTPCWFGGMQFYWAEEATEKTETDPSFRLVELVAHKLIGYTRASDELLDDSAISLESFLAGPRGFAGGAVWMEEYSFLNGTGAGQPLGVLNAGCTLTVPRTADGEVQYEDLTEMLMNFLPTAQGVWVISQSAMNEIITINGPAGNPSYVWHANAANGIPGTLLGFPVIWTEKLPVLGQPGDVLLADWSYYLLGDRQATTVESTQFDRWRYDETSWRMVHRVDGQPWLSAPLTYQDGATQVSPFVILGEKSS
jgi:HK97 family phage major capsid protein